MSVVRPARESSIVEGGWAAVRVGLDVVDVAAVGGFVASGGVLAVPVAHFDRPPQCPGEGAPPGYRDDPVGSVEGDPFEIGLRQQRHDLAGGYDGSVGELADPGEAGFAGEDG